MTALTVVGVALWLVFGCGVWLRLRQITGPDSVLPACVAVGFAGFVTLLLTGFTAFDLLVYRAPDGADARLLYDLTFGLLAMSGLPTAVALGGYAIGIYAYREMPRRSAHLATAAAAAHVVLLASFIATSGFFSLQGAVITVIQHCCSRGSWRPPSSWCVDHTRQQRAPERHTQLRVRCRLPRTVIKTERSTAQPAAIRRRGLGHQLPRQSRRSARAARLAHDSQHVARAPERIRSRTEFYPGGRRVMR